MKAIKGFKLRPLGDEYILVGESVDLINFNKMITMNETAAYLWGRCRNWTVLTTPYSPECSSMSTMLRPNKLPQMPKLLPTHGLKRVLWRIKQFCAI